MIQLHRPSQREIDAILTRDAAFNYSEVGSTERLTTQAVRESLAPRYDVDHYEFELGKGRTRFEAARSSLMAWRHLEIPWLQFHGARAVTNGQVVATVVSVAGLWFVNSCRVVYVASRPEPPSVAFAYGTLTGHAESGEERFRVYFDPSSERVVYDITSFSRPALLLAKLGYPLARRLQKRFASSSAQALARACV